MKKVILDLKNPLPEIVPIFEFVVKNKFNDFTLLSEMRKAIKEKFQNNFDKLSEEDRTNYVKIIKKFNFYDLKNFKNNPENSLDIYDMTGTLHRFKNELITFIEMKYDKNRKSYLMERQVSPPIEAYKYIGHSKTDIKPSTRSFGTLFE